MESNTILNPFEDFESSLEQTVRVSVSDAEKELITHAEREKRWKQRRLGKITSSALDDLFNFDKSGHIKTKKGIDYLLELAHQIDTGYPPEETFAKAFEWGKNYEEEALDYYNQITGNQMISGTYGFDEILFIDDVIEGFGDSPDGITDDGKGRLEIKCPYNGPNHLRNCAENVFHDGNDYYRQVLGHLLDPRAEWCDFISYDPRYPDGHPSKAKILRVYRKDVENVLDDMRIKIERWVNMLNDSDINTIINEA